MTNKIIEAAHLAGIEFQQHQGITSRVRTTTCGSQAIEKMERFYAIARAEALEDAAKVAFNADHMGSVNLKLMKNRIGNAIRALKEQP